MKNVLCFLLVLLILNGCRLEAPLPFNIETSDIDNFWEAYDKIISTQDSNLQYKYLDSLYLQKGSRGLESIRQARNYTAQDYIHAINSYPKFWASIRGNTLKTGRFSSELEKGIKKLRKVYPDIKPAKIYFTVGALRSNGTTLDSLVLIGSELALTDSNTVSTEFPVEFRADRRTYFDSNPIDNLVLLNVHEYVHTQQRPAINNLLSYTIREGVAEFISCIAMEVPSAVPAITYGKENCEVKMKFEKELFYGNNLYQWLWGNTPNSFGVRDLGYYIGYELCERYYRQSKNKKLAIKYLIELDYSNENEIENFVNGTGFFSSTLDDLYQDNESRRPTVVAIKPFENHRQDITPGINQITIEFSEPMNQEFRNFKLGPLGEEALIRVKNVVGFTEDGKSLTVEIEPLEANKKYQLTIGWGFRSLADVPLTEYLIDIKTKN